LGLPYLEAHKEIETLRASIKVCVADIEKKYGVSNKRAIMRFNASDEFKDMLFVHASITKESSFHVSGSNIEVD
jgi:hypothetical protein